MVNAKLLQMTHRLFHLLQYKFRVALVFLCVALHLLFDAIDALGEHSELRAGELKAGFGLGLRLGIGGSLRANALDFDLRAKVRKLSPEQFDKACTVVRNQVHVVSTYDRLR